MEDGYDWQGYLAPRHRKYLDRSNTEYQIEDHSNKSQFHREIRNRAEGARRDNALICDGVEQEIVPPKVLQESNKKRLNPQFVSDVFTDQAIQEHIKGTKAQGHAVGLDNFDGIEEIFEKVADKAQGTEDPQPEELFVHAVIQSMRRLANSTDAGPLEHEAYIRLFEEYWPDADEAIEIARTELND